MPGHGLAIVLSILRIKADGLKNRGIVFFCLRCPEEIDKQTAKQEVSTLLTKLPEDCSFEDIQYHLYVLQKIERRLNDAEEGRVYTQDEVEKWMAKWLMSQHCSFN